MARRPVRTRSRTKVSGTPSLQGGASYQMIATNVATIAGMPNVAFTRQELRDMLPLYDIISDTIQGELRIKYMADKYLPRPNAEDQTPANLARYEAYLMRAVFYNVTRRTAYALVGQIFLRDPQVDIPASLDVLKLDANGDNTPLQQLGQQAALHAIAYGRAGFFVDFPTTEGTLSRDQLDSGDIRPVIQEYQGRDIVNWRKALRGSRIVYTLIVVRETYTEHDDGFEAKTQYQYKVMRLVDGANAVNNIKQGFPPDYDYADTWGTAFDGIEQSPNTDVYCLETWRLTDNSSQFAVFETFYPRGHDGKFLNEIPFMFVGADKNDDNVDAPPLGDLAQLNIAHYRNSADYEETSYMTGQPTPWVAGISEEWNETVLKGNIQLGSRSVIPLPVGGAAGLLQAEANGVPKEAMDQKERQMVALGAKLVEQRQVQRTATEAQMEGTADTSILATIAKNVSSALEWAVKKCCVFTGDATSSVSVVLNTEFDLTRMDPAERQQLVLEWQGGEIAFTEMRANLRRGGIATLDDAEALTLIKQEEAVRQQAALEKLAAQAKINTKPVEPGGGAQPGNEPPANKGNANNGE